MEDEIGVIQTVERTLSVPTNIWNIPFRVKVAYRDWIGNEQVLDAQTISDYPGFGLTLNNNSIYTPGFCPDIQLTSVYVAGQNHEVQHSPQLALDPANGTLLDVTALPTWRTFSSKYLLEVKDGVGNTVFQTDPSTLLDAQSGAAHIPGVLSYGSEYRFITRGVNANGYRTEPQNEFVYTLTKSDLVINRSGQLSEDEVWNWKYRLTGDVIVPSGCALKIMAGGTVVAPQMPGVFADRHTKIIVRSGATLIVDGSLGDDSGFVTTAHYMSPDDFVNLVPSGLETRM
jgi:hypothetical protein